MLTVLGILAEIYLDNLRQETIKGKTPESERRVVEWFCSFRLLPGIMRRMR